MKTEQIDNDTEQFVSYIPIDLKRKVKIKAAVENIPMAALIREWLYLWIDGKLPTPNLTNEKKNVKEKIDVDKRRKATVK